MTEAFSTGANRAVASVRTGGIIVAVSRGVNVLVVSAAVDGVTRVPVVTVGAKLARERDAVVGVTFNCS